MREDIETNSVWSRRTVGGVRSSMSATGDAETALRQENERFRVRIAEFERRLGAFATSSLVAGGVSQPSQPAAASEWSNDTGGAGPDPTREALRQSELRCRSLLETAVDGILLLDATGFVECNPSAARMYGLAREDLIGRSPTDFSPEFQPDGQPSLEAFAIRAAAALAGEAQHFEWVSRRAGDDLFEVDVTLGRVGEAGSTLLLAICRDVSQRRCAEERLRESEEKFQAVFMNGPDALFLFTLEEGEIIDVNTPFEKLFGYSREEVTGKTALQLGLWADATGRARLVAELKAKGRVADFLAKGRKKCGDLFVGSLSMVTIMVGGKQHTIGAIRDITAAQRGEGTLRRNEAILRALLRISQRQTQTLRDFLDSALSEAIGLTESKIGHIHTYDESRQEFILNSWSKETSAECAIANPRSCCKLAETGAWGEAVRQRKAVVFNDFLAAQTLQKGYPEGQVCISRLLTLPIFKNDRIVGVVGVANKASDYDEADVLQLTLLMDGVWRSVDVRRAEQALREANARYLTIAKCIPDTIWSIDLSGRFATTCWTSTWPRPAPAHQEPGRRAHGSKHGTRFEVICAT